MNEYNQTTGIGMRIVGKKSEPILSPAASGELLKRAALFNEMMQSAMPYGQSGYIPKGVYRFKTHREANQQQDECLAKHMAMIACRTNRE